MDQEQSQLLLRLPSQLKADLQREATKQGRKLTQEINIRLRDSLKPAPEPGIAPGAAYPINVATAHHANDGKENDPQHDIRNNNEKSLVNTLTGIDQAMLEVFRKLPPEKQLALLSLFK